MIIILVFTGLAEAETDSTGFKSQKLARNLSLRGTLLPMAAGAVIFFGFSDKFDNSDDAESIIAASIGGFGIIFGPSFGHIYAGRPRYLTKGFLIRGGILGLFTAGLAFGSAMGSGSDIDARIAFPIGIAVFSAIWDISKTSESVDQFNSRKGGAQLSIYPLKSENSGHWGLKLVLKL